MSCDWDRSPRPPRPAQLPSRLPSPPAPCARPCVNRLRPPGGRCQLPSPPHGAPAAGVRVSGRSGVCRGSRSRRSESCRGRSSCRHSFSSCRVAFNPARLCAPRTRTHTCAHRKSECVCSSRSHWGLPPPRPSLGFTQLCPLFPLLPGRSSERVCESRPHGGGRTSSRVWRPATDTLPGAVRASPAPSLPAPGP